MTEHQPSNTPVLVKLSESGLVPAHEKDDVRGYNVRDKDGEDIGHVSDIFIDRDERKISMIAIRSGGFLGIGDRHFLVPVDAIAGITNHEVRLDHSREHILSSPVYDPELIEEPTQKLVEPFYGYYGLSPYGGSGYLYPEFPMSPEETVLYDHGVHVRPV